MHSLPQYKGHSLEQYFFCTKDEPTVTNLYHPESIARCTLGIILSTGLNNHILTCRASQVVPWQRICLPMQEMQETRVRSLVQEDLPEKDMETHSSTLAWKIAWTEEASVTDTGLLHSPLGCKDLT